MSIFDFDDPNTTFDDYRKTIFRHAEQRSLRCSSAEQAKRLCEEVLRHAKERMLKGEPDVAFYFYTVALQYFDTKKIKYDLSALPGMKAVFNFIHDSIIKAGAEGSPLRAKYRALVEKNVGEQPARQRIIQQQLMSNTPDDIRSHTARQSTLLQNEGSAMDQLRRRLTGAPPEISSVPPPLYSPNAAGMYSVPENEMLDTYTNDSIVLEFPTVATRAKLVFSKPPSGPRCVRRGIVNLGNTCYINSVLQMLSTCAVGEYFLQEYYEDIFERTSDYARVVNSFGFIMRDLHCGVSGPVSASYLKKSIAAVYEPFDNNRQQDANELLHVVLDAIHTGLNANKNAKPLNVEIDNTRGSDSTIAEMYWSQYIQRNSSPIVNLCTHQERSVIKCESCGSTSRSFNPSIGIELSLPKIKGTLSIEECLSRYCRKELLKGSSAYKCAKCKKEVTAEKQILFYSLPEVLFITLKRFRGDSVYSEMAKVNDLVYFGEQLDLSPFTCQNLKHTRYTLTGIVNHQGNMHGGHYTADTMAADKWWSHASDERVENVTEVNHSQAYILCYSRV